MIEKIKQDFLTVRAKQADIKAAIDVLTERKARLDGFLTSSIKSRCEAAEKARKTAIEDLAFGKISEAQYGEKMVELRSLSQEEANVKQLLFDLNEQLILSNRQLRLAASEERAFQINIFTEAYNARISECSKDFGNEIIELYALNLLRQDSA